MIPELPTLSSSKPSRIVKSLMDRSAPLRTRPLADALMQALTWLRGSSTYRPKIRCPRTLSTHNNVQAGESAHEIAAAYNQHGTLRDPVRL